MKIGLIGLGRLGCLIAKYLHQDFDLVVYDSTDLKVEAESMNLTWGEMSEIVKCDIIIPAVPISAFSALMKCLAPQLSPGVCLIDVCSVKEFPIEKMLRLLPPSIGILGTHPMFGPDSASKSLLGAKIVLCRVRIDDELYENIKKYFLSNGMKIIEATPQEHDQQISNSLILTHMIGRTLMDFGAHTLEIDTKGHRRLIKILKTVKNDSWQLFVDMNKYNRYAKNTRESFLQSLNNILGKL